MITSGDSFEVTIGVIILGNNCQCVRWCRQARERSGNLTGEIDIFDDKGKLKGAFAADMPKR